MKKLIAAAAVIAAMLACTKNEQPESGSTTTNEGFQKGQQVTLTFSASYGDKEETPQTKVTSEWNSTTSAVDFKWEAGDQVKVTVDGYPDDPAVFTLSSGAGSSTATFTGKMPDDGSKYTVQYPVDDPDITTQVYSSEEAIPHDMMKFTGNGEYSVYAHTETLTAQNAVLKLNLWGTDQTVSKIVVTNTTSTATKKPTYTLNISPAVTLSSSSSTPTPFFVVVPAGSYKFRAEVTITDAGSGSSLATPPTDAIQNGVFTVAEAKVFTTSSAKTFTAGQILNMDAKRVGFTKVYFSKGNLYYDGSAIKFEDTQYSYHSSLSAPTGLFRWAENSGNLSNDITSALSTSPSLTGTNDDVFFTNATQTTPRSDFTVAGQAGVWRTLSGKNSGEWYYLLNTRKVTVGAESKASYGEGSVNGVKGLIILPDNWDGSVCSGFIYGKSSYSNEFTESTTPTWSDMETAGCVFLPAAGYRDAWSMGNVGSSGCYRSSTPNGANGAFFLDFGSGNVNPSNSYARFYGYSVRLVCAAQ